MQVIIWYEFLSSIASCFDDWRDGIAFIIVRLYSDSNIQCYLETKGLYLNDLQMFFFMFFNYCIIFYPACRIWNTDRAYLRKVTGVDWYK